LIIDSCFLPVRRSAFYRSTVIRVHAGSHTYGCTWYE